MAGHFPPAISNEMENEFATLLENLGYRVLRKRDPETGIDIIAEYKGTPLVPSEYDGELLEPFFSAKGITAFSLKRGDFKDDDVDELIKKVKKAKKNADAKINSIKSNIMVTNYSKTEDSIDAILKKGVYCWDIRRMLFYSTKVKIFKKNIKYGPIFENYIKLPIKGSYLINPTEIIDRLYHVNVFIFIDEHTNKLIIDYGESEKIIDEIYQNAIKGIIETTHCDVQLSLSFFTLGLANEEGIRAACQEFSGKKIYKKLQLTPRYNVIQFGAAPWTTIYKDLL